MYYVCIAKHERAIASNTRTYRYSYDACIQSYEQLVWKWKNPFARRRGDTVAAFYDVHSDVSPNIQRCDFATEVKLAGKKKQLVAIGDGKLSFADTG